MDQDRGWTAPIWTADPSDPVTLTVSNYAPVKYSVVTSNHVYTLKPAAPPTGNQIQIMVSGGRESHLGCSRVKTELVTLN